MTKLEILDKLMNNRCIGVNCFNDCPLWVGGGKGRKVCGGDFDRETIREKAKKMADYIIADNILLGRDKNED